MAEQKDFLKFEDLTRVYLPSRSWSEKLKENDKNYMILTNLNYTGDAPETTGYGFTIRHEKKEFAPKASEKDAYTVSFLYADRKNGEHKVAAVKITQEQFDELTRIHAMLSYGVSAMHKYNWKLGMAADEKAEKGITASGENIAGRTERALERANEIVLGILRKNPEVLDALAQNYARNDERAKKLLPVR